MSTFNQYSNRNKQEEFLREYELQHQACPKCGSLAHSTTLMGYIVNWDHPDKYQDRNTCTCIDCGDKHIMHERVSKAKIREDKLNDLGI